MKVAFDHKASIYDTEFSYSHTGRLQRQRVWAYLETHVFSEQNSPLKILELNAGTGEDALVLKKNLFF